MPLIFSTIWRRGGRWGVHLLKLINTICQAPTVREAFLYSHTLLYIPRGHEWAISWPPWGACWAMSHSQSRTGFVRYLSHSCTFGIFLRLRLDGSPERQGVSSGLLGVEGGLIREGEEMPVSLVFLRSSRSLKLRRSEFCRKKAGLEESWWGQVQWEKAYWKIILARWVSILKYITNALVVP